MPVRACRFVLEARQQEVLLPHEVFHILYHEFPEDFDKRLRGHPGILESFCSNQAGTLCWSRATCESNLIGILKLYHLDFTEMVHQPPDWGKLGANSSTYIACFHCSPMDPQRMS